MEGFGTVEGGEAKAHDARKNVASRLGKRIQCSQVDEVKGKKSIFVLR